MANLVDDVDAQKIEKAPVKMDKDVHLVSTLPMFWQFQNPPRLESCGLEMVELGRKEVWVGWAGGWVGCMIYELT